MNTNMTIFTHHPRVSLARSSFCWWRHNRLLMTSQWPDNSDMIMWIVIYNSLQIFSFTAIFTAGRYFVVIISLFFLNLVLYLPIFFRVDSLSLGRSYDYPRASEETLEAMGIIDHYLTTVKHWKHEWFDTCFRHTSPHFDMCVWSDFPKVSWHFVNEL